MHAPPALPETASTNGSTGTDGAEFDRLYRDFHQRIYNLTARILGNPDDAADVTQEVFLKAYAYPPERNDNRGPGPWLYRIAVNASYDHLRRRAARPVTTLDTVPEIAATGDAFAGAETASLVESCLADLTPRYRTALVLKDLHGLSYAEIADVMGLHHGAARVLLHRARAAFRRAFCTEAPGKAGGMSTLGLAAFLSDLPVPASLRTPPWAYLTPAAPTPDAPVHPLPAAPGGALPAASVAPSAATAPAAVAPLAPSGLLAGLGGVTAVKTAMAAVAVVAATAGGGAIGHHVTPTEQHTPAPSAQTPAVTVPAYGPGFGGQTYLGLMRERLELMGLGSTIRGAGGDSGRLSAGEGFGGAARPNAGGSAGTTGGGSGGTGLGFSGGIGSGGSGAAAGTGSGTGSGGVAGSGDAGSGGGTGGTNAGGTGTGGYESGGSGAGGTDGVDGMSAEPSSQPATGGSGGGSDAFSGNDGN